MRTGRGSGGRTRGDRSRALVHLLRLLPAVLYMGLIWWLSSQPAAAVGSSDKLLHLAEFGLLAGLLLLGLGGSVAARRAWWLSLGIAALYGVLDEVHQLFVPGRVGDPADALADAVGALLALVFLSALRRPGRRRPG